MKLVFPSYEYIFLFLPAVLAGYHLIRRSRRADGGAAARSGKMGTDRFELPERLRGIRPEKLWLLAASLLFYLSFGTENFSILLVQAILGYITVTLLIRHHPTAQIRKNTGFEDGIVLGVPSNNSLKAAEKLTQGIYLGGVGLLLFLLCFYKYISPFLPVALSFTTFSLIELLSEARDGELEEISVIDYLLFFFFFPKLLQGPIMCYTDFRDSLSEAGLGGRAPHHAASVTASDPGSAPAQGPGAAAAGWISGFATALFYFVLGLGKKVLIADRLGAAVDFAWSVPSELLWSEAVLTVICYSLQIYFDFSGYCDMGRAAAWMLGFDLPVNFDKPYRAAGIRDFWHRWHRSLTQFLTKRLYFPLGGSRNGLLRTLCNTMIVFLLSGLWHGEGLTFLLWGVLHGAASCMERLLGTLPRVRRAAHSRILSSGQTDPASPQTTAPKDPAIVPLLRVPGQWALRLLTWLFVTFAWIFFRAPSLSAACVILDRIFDKPWFVLHDKFIQCFLVNELWYPLKVLGVPDARTGGIVCLWLLIGFAAIAAFFLPSAEQIALRFDGLLTQGDPTGPDKAAPSEDLSGEKASTEATETGEAAIPQQSGTACRSHALPVVLTAVITAGLFLWCVFSLGEVASFLYFDF